MRDRLLRLIRWRLRGEIARLEAEIAASESRQRMVMLGSERRGLVRAIDLMEAVTRSESKARTLLSAAALPPRDPTACSCRTLAGGDGR
jgi:hypothetical protein